MSSSLAPPIAFAVGIATHIFFFKRGEHFLYPFRYVQGVLLLAAAGTIFQKSYQEVPPLTGFLFMLRLIGNGLVGLFFSLITYRLFFNPLNKFPGPYFARLSKFDFCFRAVKMDSHHQLHKLHQKYGKFVRIGPNDLSVIDADGVQVVSAPNSRCIKGPWYQQDTPLISMHTTRDRSLHDRRRRQWAPAFSDKSLRGYEERIQGYNDVLINSLLALRGKPASASKWFNLYSFDVMGDLGFGQSFDMLEAGEKHWAIKLLGEGMDPLGLGLPTWFFRLLVAIPGLSGGYHKFIAFCSKRLDDRMKVQSKADPSKPDIIHTLIEQYEQSPNKRDALPMIQGDSRLIIVAGSDTTAASLVHLFYWLAKRQDLQKKLREQLNGQITGQELQNNEFLNAMINESLRLNPPVPSGVFRKTPSEGVNIGKTYVPGNTIIQMPMYAMGHDESLFVNCEEFIPERFSTKPELIKHKDAFGPFSAGPFACIGRNLAYLEIRTVTAQLLSKFDVKFAEGEDGSALLMKSRDHFTLELEDLNLVFEPRV